LIFAAPRCADIPELIEIRSLFGSKYGKEFVAAAAELRPDCGVNRMVSPRLISETFLCRWWLLFLVDKIHYKILLGIGAKFKLNLLIPEAGITVSPSL
jgi:hypothetical protein